MKWIVYCRDEASSSSGASPNHDSETVLLQHSSEECSGDSFDPEKDDDSKMCSTVQEFDPEEEDSEGEDGDEPKSADAPQKDGQNIEDSERIKQSVAKVKDWIYDENVQRLQTELQCIRDQLDQEMISSQDRACQLQTSYNHSIAAYAAELSNALQEKEKLIRELKYSDDLCMTLRGECSKLKRKFALTEESLKTAIQNYRHLSNSTAQALEERQLEYDASKRCKKLQSTRRVACISVLFLLLVIFLVAGCLPMLMQGRRHVRLVGIM
jgi:hypothetical protein